MILVCICRNANTAIVTQYDPKLCRNFLAKNRRFPETLCRSAPPCPRYIYCASSYSLPCCSKGWNVVESLVRCISKMFLLACSEERISAKLLIIFSSEKTPPPNAPSLVVNEAPMKVSQ